MSGPAITEGRVHRRIAPGLLAATVAAALLTAAPASARALQISPGGGPPFPARTLVLTAPGGGLSADRVHVLENGQPVGGLVVTPLISARKGDFGVVLLIDTSGSMAGVPIERAMAAARALAAGRSANEQIGVIEFNHHTRVVLPLTADTKAIDSALATTPAARGGTHLFDAAAVGLRLLLQAKIAAGAVIVVSDGGDRGSRLNAEAAAALGRPAHYGIFTVGVRDRGFDPRSLAALASAGGGTFVATDPSQLHRILVALQALLSNRYVVHYRSLQAFDKHVSVSVTIDGVAGGASLSYATPVPPTAAARAAGAGFWTSTLALLCFAFAAAALLGVAIAFIFVPRRRREGLRARVGRFTDTSSPVVAALPAETSTPGLIDRIERSLRTSPRWERFTEELEIAGIETSPLRVIVRIAIAIVAAGVVISLVSGVAVLGVLVLVLGPVLGQSAIRQRLRRRRKLFSEALPGHLEEIASAMRAGHSIVAGLAVTAEGASEPARTEFRRVVADEELGMPLATALEPVARRMDSRDTSQLALVASLHNRTGGNMAEVLDRLAVAARDRAEMRRELEALTAQARLSRYIVTLLPVVVLLIVAIGNPGYVHPLFHTTSGVIVVMVAAGMVILASVVMRKIVEIQV